MPVNSIKHQYSDYDPLIAGEDREIEMVFEKKKPQDPKTVLFWAFLICYTVT
jgi:hypothetical protein